MVQARVESRTDVAEDESGRTCHLSSRLAERLDKEHGDHVRLENDYLAAHAEVEQVTAGAEETIWLSGTGRDRIGTRPGETVHVDATIPLEGGYMAAWPRGDFSETLWGDERGDLLISCPHGGDIEFGTDDIGARLFRSLRATGTPVTAWLCHGFNSGFASDAFSRWHMKKPVTAADAYPELERMLDWRFAYVVGIHMHSYSEYIAVGGRAPDSLRESVGDALRETLPADFEIRTDYDEMALAGRGETSSVNYFCDGTGVQLELPPMVCYRYRKRVADALHDVYGALLEEE
ncbi:hypothetical protein GCM10009037_26930 [Halarchaeum grantii]|uniref:Phage-related replication protein YjqB, UPF0714/DUF867 family n=1 Tax=Halarchaeum grantii TaxID=1193105 RepID=A0A830FCQ8_9EURY|nr:poly-gamma-glutamate hydrolase family protein [Halarchaeum grantii]GGL42008.1 hypothetical protein GCM10009037_26930 [Halarchaeum grantii]